MNISDIRQHVINMKLSNNPLEYNISIEEIEFLMDKNRHWNFLRQLSEAMPENEDYMYPRDIIESADMVVKSDADSFDSVVYFLYFVYMRNIILEEPIKSLLKRMGCNYEL